MPPGCLGQHWTQNSLVLTRPVPCSAPPPDAGNIRVIARVRPITKEDGEGPEATNAVTFDPDDDSIIHLLHKGKPVSFELDKVFSPRASQQDVSVAPVHGGGKGERAVEGRGHRDSPGKGEMVGGRQKGESGRRQDGEAWVPGSLSPSPLERRRWEAKTPGLTSLCWKGQIHAQPHPPHAPPTLKAPPTPWPLPSTPPWPALSLVPPPSEKQVVSASALVSPLPGPTCQACLACAVPSVPGFTFAAPWPTVRQAGRGGAVQVTAFCLHLAE